MRLQVLRLQDCRCWAKSSCDILLNYYFIQWPKFLSQLWSQFEEYLYCQFLISFSFFPVTWPRVELLLRHWKEFQKSCSAYFPYLVYLWKYFCLTFCPNNLTLNSGGSNPSSTIHITVNPLKLRENTLWIQDGKKHNSLELWFKSMGMCTNIQQGRIG